MKCHVDKITREIQIYQENLQERQKVLDQFIQLYQSSEKHLQALLTKKETEWNQNEKTFFQSSCPYCQQLFKLANSHERLKRAQVLKKVIEKKLDVISSDQSASKNHQLEKNKN